jgi:hypothetical protein
VLALKIVVVLSLIPLDASFWIHCARPCLVGRRARPLAFWIAGGTSLATAATSLGSAWLVIAGRTDVAFWLYSVGGIAWLIVLGGGYFDAYRVLVRWTGGPAPRSVGTGRPKVPDRDAARG